MRQPRRRPADSTLASRSANHSVREYDSGRTLVGGTPATAVFLSDSAAGLLNNRNLRVGGGSSRALAERLMDLGMADPVVRDLPEMDPESVTVVIPVRDRCRQPEQSGRRHSRHRRG
jgi:hypothetical protein